MKSSFVALFVLLGFSISQGTTLISPDKPKLGERVTLSHETGGGRLKSPPKLNAQILIMRENSLPLLLEVPMVLTDSLWVCEFTLADQFAKFLMIRFVSTVGKNDNSGKYWTALVHGTDGKPVQGAYLERANTLSTGGFADFKMQRDPAAAKSALAEELSLYPGSWQAKAMQWRILMKEAPGEESMTKIRTELETVYNDHKENETAVNAFLYWFEQTGQQERAEKIAAQFVAANPRGKVAENKANARVYGEKDPAKQASLLEQFMVEFPQPPERTVVNTRFLLSLYLRSGQTERAVAFLMSQERPDPMICNQIAWNWVENDQRLEDAVQLAKRGVDVLRSPEPWTKPSYMTEAQWVEQNNQSLGLILDTYGLALEKVGRNEDALKAYKEAHAISRGGEAEMNERYVALLIKTGDFAIAERVCEDAVRGGKSSDSLVVLYRKAYAGKKGSPEGFEAALAKAKGEAEKTMKADAAKGMLSVPAPEFALPGLDGKTVRLADLKGKVVVVDFWATWCGPCKMSFPYLQKVFDEYKSNPKVVILALNTWEREQGAARDLAVRKFLKDNKYTFPVLFDDKVVEKFGVEGIPTKFVIDQKGLIRFKSIGFDGGDKMVAELRTQIGMLLSSSEGAR